MLRFTFLLAGALALQFVHGEIIDYAKRYKALGCFEDNENRAFEYGPYQSGGMKPSVCYRHCKSRGYYKYFGLQHGNECFCGNGQYDRYGRAADWRCGHRCEGNNNVWCGGNYANNVYQVKTAVITTTQSPPPFSYVGCYQDGQNPIERTMIYFETSSDMTVERCLDKCEAKKYRYAGLQYKNECWCSDDLDALSKRGKLDDGKCDQCCSGGGGCDNKCGGSWANSVYTRGCPGGGDMSPLYNYKGCFQDDGGRRTMDRVMDSAEMTVQKCLNVCRNKGYRYAGIQNSNECYCSRTRSYERISRLTNDRCNMCCQGDPNGGGGSCNYPCGSGWVNSVYRV